MGEFVRVAKADELAPGQGKLVEVGEKLIALFNIDGSFHAIDDTCTHMGGPLSEGELEGTRITCPWHGYQYLPHNGQSPPPFKEKVATYDVKLIGTEVWLNPLPYPEGTERPGAVIERDNVKLKIENVKREKPLL